MRMKVIDKEKLQYALKNIDEKIDLLNNQKTKASLSLLDWTKLI